MKRRDFLKHAAVPPAAALAGHLTAESTHGAAKAATRSTPMAKLARRRYGRHDVKLSVIGFGGYMIQKMEQAKVNRHVAEAVERGVNYFDVAPTYGNAQVLLGPALKPYRKDVFLACKTTERSAAGSAKELAGSLKQLRTDHVDLYQLHALTKVEKDVDAVFAKGGAMETFIKAKEDGRVRFIGFSAHSEEAALAALERYPFDSILFPVNFACEYQGDFGPRVIDQASKQGAAILAIKAMAKQRYPKDSPKTKTYPNCWYEPLDEPETVAMALRYALQYPITSIVPSADVRLFNLALHLVGQLGSWSKPDEQHLRALGANLTPVFKGS